MRVPTAQNRATMVRTESGARCCVAVSIGQELAVRSKGAIAVRMHKAGVS